ncbi:hypothetical protein HDU97_008400 [Phlyctochytrium planicorne]|nr:hypothetical protein HDU97_008400 [Phlyctochytrium planicorne]
MQRSNDCKLIHSSRGGENMWSIQGVQGFGRPMSEAVLSWTDKSEQDLWHNNGFYDHYTQVIWGKTEFVGCGKAVAQASTNMDALRAFVPVELFEASRIDIMLGRLKLLSSILFKTIAIALATATAVASAPATPVAVPPPNLIPIPNASANNTNTSAHVDLAKRDVGLGSWVLLPGFLRQIDVSENGKYVVGVDRYDKNIPDPLRQATVCDDGSIWGVNGGREILYSRYGDGNWYKVPGLLTNIDCGSPGVFGIGINNGDIYTWTGQWTQIPGALSQISSGANGVWGVSSSNEIFQLNGDRSSRTKIDGGLSWVSSGSNGMAWGVTRVGEIFYRFNWQSQWTKIDGLLKNIAAGPNVIYGTNIADSTFTRTYF